MALVYKAVFPRRNRRFASVCLDRALTLCPELLTGLAVRRAAVRPRFFHHGLVIPRKHQSPARHPAKLQPAGHRCEHRNEGIAPGLRRRPRSQDHRRDRAFALLPIPRVQPGGAPSGSSHAATPCSLRAADASDGWHRRLVWLEGAFAPLEIYAAFSAHSAAFNASRTGHLQCPPDDRSANGCPSSSTCLHVVRRAPCSQDRAFQAKGAATSRLLAVRNRRFAVEGCLAYFSRVYRR